MTHPVAEGGVEYLNEHLSYIVAYPFVKDGTEEVPPLLGTHAEVRQRTVLAVADMGKMSAVVVLADTLYDGRKLDVATTDFLEEMVEVKGIVGVEVSPQPWHSIRHRVC